MGALAKSDAAYFGACKTTRWQLLRPNDLHASYANKTNINFSDIQLVLLSLILGRVYECKVMG